MESSAVCRDGRTVRRISSTNLFKYAIEEPRKTFKSCLDKPQAAYDNYLKWVDVYRTPDNLTVHRCFTLSEMHKYLVQETGQAFYSSHKNIYDAYTDPDKSLYKYLLAEQSN